MKNLRSAILTWHLLDELVSWRLPPRRRNMQCTDSASCALISSCDGMYSG